MAAAIPLALEGLEAAGTAVGGYLAGRAASHAQGRIDRFLDRSAKRVYRKFQGKVRRPGRYYSFRQRRPRRSRHPGTRLASDEVRRYFPRQKMAYYRKRKTRGYSRRRWRKRRRYARFSKRRIGMPVGSGTCKKHLVRESIDQAMATRTLVQEDLADIGRAVNHEINLRERDLANLRGVKMCLMFRSLSNIQPIIVHIAILVPKAETVVVTNDFFRSYGTSRSEDAATTANSNVWNCHGINADLYTIIMHKKYFLIGTSSSLSESNSWRTENGRSFFRFKKYLKIKRQVRYDSATVPVTGNPILVYWCDYLSSTSAVGSVADQVRYDEHIITYFRDPYC